MQRSMIKLYAMVRAREEWTFEEPSLNKEGLPAIHDIARALGVGGHSDTELDMFPENEIEANKLIEKLRAEEVANGDSKLKRESSDDTPYMARQHSKQSSHSGSDTSFSTSEPASVVPQQSNGPMRLAPKTLAPLQIDQMAYLPADLTAAGQFDAEFFEGLEQTSPLYSDFTQESFEEQGDDMLWVNSPAAVPTMAMAGIQSTTVQMQQRLDPLGAMNGLRGLNSYEEQARQAHTHAYVYGVGAGGPGVQQMNAMAGTIRPGMLEKSGDVSYEERRRSNMAGVDNNPWSFKNFQPPQ